MKMGNISVYIKASWRRASSCHATTDIEDKIISQILPLVHKHRETAEPKHPHRAKSSRMPTKTLMSVVSKNPKATMVETFSRQMYAHTYTHGVQAHTYTHKSRETRTLSPTRTHTHRLLWMWVTGPCSPSSVRKQSRSLLCSPTASAR